MSRKHFRILADAIRMMHDRERARIIADFLADVLYRCNSNFRASTFLKASGFEYVD